MALTPQQLAKAKAEAIQILEFSIYTLAFTLGVDESDLEFEMENPVDLSVDGNNALLAQYDAYECLKMQLAALARLQA
jgi:hypothetical protein